MVAACHVASGGSQPCTTTGWLGAQRGSEVLSGSLHVSWTLLSLLLAERGRPGWSHVGPSGPEGSTEARGGKATP